MVSFEGNNKTDDRVLFTGIKRKVFITAVPIGLCFLQKKCENFCFVQNCISFRFFSCVINELNKSK